MGVYFQVQGNPVVRINMEQAQKHHVLPAAIFIKRLMADNKGFAIRWAMISHEVGNALV